MVGFCTEIFIYLYGQFCLIIGIFVVEIWPVYRVAIGPCFLKFQVLRNAAQPVLTWFLTIFLLVILHIAMCYIDVLSLYIIVYLSERENIVHQYIREIPEHEIRGV